MTSNGLRGERVTRNNVRRVMHEMTFLGMGLPPITNDDSEDDEEVD